MIKEISIQETNNYYSLPKQHKETIQENNFFEQEKKKKKIL